MVAIIQVLYGVEAPGITCLTCFSKSVANRSFYAVVLIGIVIIWTVNIVQMLDDEI